MKEYKILLDGQAVGTAKVAQEGLYYRFSCRCRFDTEEIYRLQVRSGEECIVLGIPVPRNGIFELNTRIPIKKLGSGNLQIEAVPKQPLRKGKFVPLSPEEPFRYLRRLENAFLEVRGCEVGVVIEE